MAELIESANRSLAGIADAKGASAFDLTPTPPVAPRNEGPDDLPADTSTTGTITVGTPFQGEIEPGGDRDWIALEVVAGESYRINLSGADFTRDDGTVAAASPDTFLRLFDANGNLIDSNDDSNGTLFSEIVFTAAEDGTVYISAGSFSDSNPGGYTVTVTQPEPPLLGTDGDDVLTVVDGITAVDAGAGDDIVNLALDLAANPSMQLGVIDGGNGIDTFDASQLVLGEEDLGRLEFGGTFDTRIGTGVANTFVFGDFLELPSDNGFTSVTPLVNFERLIGSDYRDVLLAYGDTIYADGGAGNDRIFTTNSDAVLIGGAGADEFLAFDGAENTNVFVSYETSTEGLRVSLSRNDTFATGDAVGDAFDLAQFGFVGGINNLRGSDFDDFLEGDANDNVLDGGAGNDRFVGGDGADTFVGGEGRDLVIYARSADGVVVNLVRGSASGGDAQGDSFSGIENVLGSQAADRLIGSNEGNILSGLGGDDVLSGLGGADNLIGGAGNDRLFGGDGVDALLGGAGNDRLFGGDGGDALYGGEGDDLLSGGAGRDTLDGGEGFDTADYRTSDTGIVADLTGADRTGDILRSIERVIGSEFDDSITGGTDADILLGGAGADTLFGGAGNDSLFGGAGDDVLQGGDGRDFLTGGAGADTFVVGASDTGRSTVLDFESGDRIDLSELGEDFDTFAEVQAAARNAASTVVIFLGNSSLQLLDMQVEDLTADMFSFGGNAVA